MKNCAQLQKWIFYLFIQNPKCASHSKWCHQMLQNDVIKCCKMMSPHSNEPATWRNCVSRRHFSGMSRILHLSHSTPGNPEHYLNRIAIFWTWTQKCNRTMLTKSWEVVFCLCPCHLNISIFKFNPNVTETFAKTQRGNSNDINNDRVPTFLDWQNSLTFPWLFQYFLPFFQYFFNVLSF